MRIVIGSSSTGVNANIWRLSLSFGGIKTAFIQINYTTWHLIYNFQNLYFQCYYIIIFFCNSKTMQLFPFSSSTKIIGVHLLLAIKIIFTPQFANYSCNFHARWKEIAAQQRKNLRNFVNTKSERSNNNYMSMKNQLNGLQNYTLSNGRLKWVSEQARGCDADKREMYEEKKIIISKKYIYM